MHVISKYGNLALSGIEEFKKEECDSWYYDSGVVEDILNKVATELKKYNFL